MRTTLNLITPDGAVAQALTVPTQWADVTLAQYVALLAPAPDDERSQAEILCGLAAGGLGQLAADDVGYLANLLEFAQHSEAVTQLLPPPGLPDVGSLPYGCLLLVQQHFDANAERPLLAYLPYVLAVYRCQLTWGSTDKLAETLAAVLAAPVTEVWAEAQAFTTACRSWLAGTRPMKPTPPTPKTKSLTQEAKTWLSGLGLRFRSTPSPAAAS